MASIVGDQFDFEYYRYCVARDLCEGRDVLDVPSGQGFGAALLSRVARTVSGVETDARLLAHAETK
jgi:protein-L-isoaspartate O-methyltransferase